MGDFYTAANKIKLMGKFYVPAKNDFFAKIEQNILQNILFLHTVPRDRWFVTECQRRILYLTHGNPGPSTVDVDFLRP